MRIVQVMEAAHRYQQGFQALARIVRTRCAAGRLFFNSQFIPQHGQVARVAPFNAIEPQGSCMLPQAARHCYAVAWAGANCRLYL